MNKIEIGGLVALVLAVAAGATVVARLEGRLDYMESQLVPLPGIEQEIGDALSAVGEHHCRWESYLSRVELENGQQCPRGYYAKGVGFRHEHGRDLAYQMEYRLYCCALHE